MPQYVLAIGHLPDTSEVVVIRKNRPAWQAGRLNFPGGKLELGETARQAVAREFGEETGVWLPPEVYRPVALVERTGQFEMFVFAVTDPLLVQVSSLTDEQVLKLPVAELLVGSHPMIENLPWLFGLAHDGYAKLAHIRYD